MKSATERRSLQEVSEMAIQSLNPDEYEKFQMVHDALIMRRSIPGDALIDYEINKNVSCVTCNSYGGAWIYCPILSQMLIIDGFDETGELHGCNAHSKVVLFYYGGSMSENLKRYLGDGVYAIADAAGIWLHANDHLYPTDRIYLESSVLRELNTFAKDVKIERELNGREG